MNKNVSDELGQKKLNTKQQQGTLGNSFSGAVVSGNDNTGVESVSVPVMPKPNLQFFLFQCAAARAAVDAWCLMARRINGKVYRDIRKKIGMLIWEARELGNYKEKSADEVASQAKRHRLS